MSIGNSLGKNSLFIGESIMFLIIIGSSIIMFTYIDIISHDFYALPVGAECYTGNNSSFCQKIDQLHNCPTGGDACIEAKYSQMLTIEAGWLAGLMVFIKLSLAVLFKRKINATRIIQALIWGGSPVVLLWTGWEDFLYYFARNMPVPNSLPWLTNAGLFPLADKNILHIMQATSMSLYIVMAIGFVIVVTMLYFNMKITRNAGYQTPI
jgi:hypothetical protein